MTPLEKLEALSAEIAALSAQLADNDDGSRIGLVRQRLKVALDELARYTDSAGDITDE